ncbi:MAG: hypothetical protein HZA47_06715 [Planctomycetes bacterium]|uniref:hypothetical protein n=1 Tax=Candidatus Wunengus sp. YC65 TaxID=3367701 RepID=UPI001D4C0029|nr:hypothetical protein [Planctomycetota bacterium]
MKRKVIIPYKPKLKEVARKLRGSGTLSEVLLWTYLKKNIQGVLWVIEDWIRKHKEEPTPNPSQEGKKKAAGDSRGVNKYTPRPSQEGNKKVPSSEGKQGWVRIRMVNCEDASVF